MHPVHHQEPHQTTPQLFLLKNVHWYNHGYFQSNYPIPHVYDITSCPSSTIPVTLTIRNSCGSTVFSNNIGPILAKPVANFTAALKTCVGSSVIYTNTTVAGYNQSCSRLTNYTWNFGDGTPNVTTGNIYQKKTVYGYNGFVIIWLIKILFNFWKIAANN